MTALSHASLIFTCFLGCLVTIFAAMWMLEKVFDKALSVFKVKVIFCEYIWHQKSFKKWLAESCAVSPAAPVTDAATSVVAARNPEKEGLR